MKQLSIISLLLCLFWGCQDAIEESASGEAGDLTGQVVQFGGYLPGGIATKAEPYADYSRMSQAYTLRVAMWQKGKTTPLATASYAPKSTNEESNKGLLQPKTGETALYWPNSVTACGFTATAGSDALAADQSKEEKWLEQDRLDGYAAVPEEVATSEATTPSYVVPEAAQYKTHKAWYQANRAWLDNLGLTSADRYKVVPLFMKHQRAWISVILKAGEGVKPEDLAYEKTQTSLTAEIHSYATTAAAEGGEATTTALKVSPWKRAHEVDYGGKVGKRSSTRLEAIVQPFDYAADAERPICVLNLSNMKYSFYAKNDSRFMDETKKEEWKSDYHLTAGKHLVITVTLNNDRKVLITSYLEDWTEVSEEIPSDDYGNQSPPIQIPSVEKLKDFLDTSTKNAAGQMGVITQSLDLSGATWVGTHTLKATLNLAGNTLTLNNKPLLKELESSATLTNGLIKVKGTVQAAVCEVNSGSVDRIRVDEENPAACAWQAGLVVTNHGFITSCSSNLNVAGDYEDENTPPTAYDRTKMLYIGGIAGVSIPKEEGQTTVPTISHCTVTARVDLAKAIKEKVGKPIGENIVNGKPFTPLKNWKNGHICGGGIVGAATGIVSDNKFEYGITLLTNSYVEGQAVHFRNIVYKEATGFTGRTLRAEGNEWPTNVPNSTTPDPETGTQITNARTTPLYDGVINSQAELQALVWENSVRNQVGKRYRVAESFTIYSDDAQSENKIGWRLGEKSPVLTNAHRGNVLFELDGNDMTITLDGTKMIDYKDSKEGTPITSDATAPMLFINITGKIHDLTVHCAKSLYGIPVYGLSGQNELTDICSPLGYALVGGELENVKVTAADGVFIQAAVAAGMVCWAKSGATMTNCESAVGVRLRYGADLPPAAVRYAGGLVAQAGRATLTNCRYASPEELAGGNLICKNDKNPKNPTGEGTVYIGGIVGGTVVESAEGASAEEPHLVMKDCSSWYEKGLDKASIGETTKGSIIGRSNYAPSRDEVVQGVYECEGNWWPVGKVGVGTWTLGLGLTEEKVIGKRNGVQPAKPVTVN